jgi:hypothetical protein
VRFVLGTVRCEKAGSSITFKLHREKEQFWNDQRHFWTSFYRNETQSLLSISAGRINRCCLCKQLLVFAMYVKGEGKGGIPILWFADHNCTLRSSVQNTSTSSLVRRYHGQNLLVCALTDLFIYSLFNEAFSVTQTHSVECKDERWIMNWKECRRKRPRLNLRLYPGMCGQTVEGHEKRQSG